MGVKGADGNGDSRFHTELLRPFGTKFASDVVRRGEAALETLGNTGQQRIDFGKKSVARESAQRSVPEPFVAHGADAARDTRRIALPGENGGDQDRKSTRLNSS